MGSPKIAILPRLLSPPPNHSHRWVNSDHVHIVRDFEEEYYTRLRNFVDFVLDQP